MLGTLVTIAHDGGFETTYANLRSSPAGRAVLLYGKMQVRRNGDLRDGAATDKFGKPQRGEQKNAAKVRLFHAQGRDVQHAEQKKSRRIDRCAVQAEILRGKIKKRRRKLTAPLFFLIFLHCILATRMLCYNR
mgnify:CR=1 FL=1